MARASGESVLRAGHPSAAVSFFRKAARLGHGESQMRVRECETHVRGGLNIVRKVGSGTAAVTASHLHSARRQPVKPPLKDADSALWRGNTIR
jgi:hypothetical protein